MPQVGRAISFVGSTLALALMTVISVLIGYGFKSVPDALKSSVPIGRYLSVACMFYFGVRTLQVCSLRNCCVIIPLQDWRFANFVALCNLGGCHSGSLADTERSRQQRRRICICTIESGRGRKGRGLENSNYLAGTTTGAGLLTCLAF